MQKALLLLFCFLSTTACKKDTPRQPRTPAQILTSQPWILQGIGFDDNGNGLIDAAENILTDCQKDNTYAFNADGTGIIKDVGLICDGVTHNFKWKLVNENKALDFETYVAPIIQLSEKELILTNEYLTDNFRMVYKR